ncbi:phosphotransferase [Nonomuraea jabiensis]|uniref:Aminoglycoside phosphotransferase domain-containing protein n=1 Tax=Nonomuraea jabiensis TaxID=882448 RepID=A0A7W9G5V4_9ACTN|nr:phosphotransferase [Nonomuraea jabiensis]MBB5777780.1 hypothetical protein [Nonomuraea jabiensis]
MTPAVAAVCLAGEHGIRVVDPVVLNDSFNLRVHLCPALMTAGRALAELHEAMRGFPGELPYLGPVLDEPLRLLELLDGEVPPGVLARLRDAHADLAERLAGRTAQAVHGDAHPGNLLAAPAGLLWNAPAAPPARPPR